MKNHFTGFYATKQQEYKIEDEKKVFRKIKNYTSWPHFPECNSSGQKWIFGKLIPHRY